jgi:hypothetical protein
MQTLLCRPNAWAIAVLVFLLPLGCGKTGVAPTCKVRGVVTYKGVPVADASVTFTPESGRPATGVTDESGEFVLSTFAKNDGAVPGLHKVSIAPGATQVEPMPGTPEAEQAARSKPALPRRYRDPELSGFTAPVKEGEKNHFTFDMVD